jgi:hypothetical protein
LKIRALVQFFSLLKGFSKLVGGHPAAGILRRRLFEADSVFLDQVLCCANRQAARRRRKTASGKNI